MHRISTDIEYLQSGKIIIDADGIPVDVPDRSVMDAADQALGERVDDEKWWRPRLGSASTLDTLYGPSAVGIYPVTSAVGGLPVSAAGWVNVLYNSATSSTTHIYTAASYAVSGEWQREYWLGEWRAWRDTSMGTAIQGKAPLVHEHTASQITDLHHYSGTGFPEGKVTAPVGATYTDTAATIGAIRWIKTSGTGDTGWTVQYGDTGARLFQVAGNGNIKAGEAALHRSGNVVTYIISNIEFIDDVVGSINVILSRLPLGFRATNRQRSPLYIGINAASVASFNISTLGFVNVYKQESEIGELSGVATFTTTDPWPTTLPGTPA